MSALDLDLLLRRSDFELSVYEVRIQALDRLLTEEETARLLIHMAQRRGYQSNSKAEEAKDKENGKVKTAISENRNRMTKNGYRTVGEMLWNDPAFHLLQSDGTVIHKIHNTADEYKVTVERSMLREELELIFHAQRAMGAAWATEEFCERYLAIWGGQRNFDEGPGGDSPYGGNQVFNKIGKCTLEKGELRAAKACFTFEYFKLLQDLNHIRLAEAGSESRSLTEEEREAVKACVMSNADITYAKIRKILNLPNGVTFNNLFYGRSEGKQTMEDVIAKQEKKKLKEMQSYHVIRRALNKVEKNAITQLTMEDLDRIGFILTCFKSDDNRLEQLTATGIPEKFHKALLELSFVGFGHLSASAMKKLIPYLETGITYDKAVVAAYGENTSVVCRKRKLSLKDMDDITNPVVRRAVSQSIKVINAVVREYGPPEIVRIELAREMGRSRQDRDAIEKKKDQNAKRNEEIKKQIAEYKTTSITGQDIVKFKLFQQQNGVCLYSGKNLDISRLFEAGYVDVDHIVPYSTSLDDSYTNKVLVLARENRQKGNRLPYGYFGEDAARWDRFETLVSTNVRDFRKRKNLLLKTMPDQDGFKKRNLVDTQYLSRVLFRLIDEHLEFADYGGKRKRRTQSVNGVITSEVRKRLGIEKIRANGDLHHAADAAVIACISPGMIQKITKYSQFRERFYASGAGYVDAETGEILTREQYDAKYDKHFPEPWRFFRKELEARLSEDPRTVLELLKLPAYEDLTSVRPIFVSRMPNHKVTGAAHKDTIRSAKMEGHFISKKPLTELKLKNGELEGYYRPDSDRLLYEALQNRLLQYGGDAKKAFAEPFYKPKADGTRGPLVKKVKLYEKTTENVAVNGGIAENGGMVRVDVFYVEDDGYYFIPIYTADTKKKALPNHAVVAGKPHDEWKVMQEENFLFSLYSGDLIYVRSKNDLKLKRQKDGTGALTCPATEGLFYYNGLNISTGAIGILTHNRAYFRNSLGGKTLASIEKYEVDVLGNYTKVSLPEKRLRFR